MANKELHSIITIDNEDYSITAAKVAQSLTIGGKSYDGSSAVQVTAADLGIGGGLTPGNGISIVDDAVTAKPGNGITVDTTGINHADTSSQTSITAEGRRYITGVTLDDYGHVTGLTTGTETSSGTGTDTNQKVKAGSVTFGANDEINFVGSGSVTVTGNATDKTITISATAGGQGDLSAYATKEYVDEAIDSLEEVIPTHTGQLTNDSGYLTSIPVTMDSGDTYTTITISKNEPSNGSIGDIWFKY